MDAMMQQAQQLINLINVMRNDPQKAQMMISHAVNLGIQPPDFSNPQHLETALMQLHQRPTSAAPGTVGSSTPFMPDNPQATLGALLSGGK